METIMGQTLQMFDGCVYRLGLVTLFFITVFTSVIIYGCIKHFCRWLFNVLSNNRFVEAYKMYKRTDKECWEIWCQTCCTLFQGWDYHINLNKNDDQYGKEIEADAYHLLQIRQDWENVEWHTKKVMGMSPYKWYRSHSINKYSCKILVIKARKYMHENGKNTKKPPFTYSFEEIM